MWRKICPKKLVSLIGILLLIYLLKRTGIGNIAHCLVNANQRYMLLSLILFIPIGLSHAYRWKLILNRQQIGLPFRIVFELYLVGLFYGLITPGKIGSFIRVYLLRERTNAPLGQCGSSVLIDRIMDFFALLLLAIIGATLLVQGRPGLFFVTALFLAFLLVGLFVLINRRRMRLVLTPIVRFILPLSLREKLKPEFDSFYKNMPGISSLILPYFTGLLGWICLYTQAYLVALALDVQIPFIHFITITPIATIVGFIPITISGFGTRDAMFVSLLSTFGVTVAKALTLSLLGYTVNAILPAIYGLPFVIAGRKMGDVISSEELARNEA